MTNRTAPADLQRSVSEQLGSAREARWLMEAVLGRNAALDSPTESDLCRIEEMVARRLAGEPLQYVIGTWAFRSLELTVDRRCLIPRPETEQVVEVALAEICTPAEANPAPVVVDLGTGSGAIALSVAIEGPVGVSVWATDVNEGTLALARENSTRVADSHPACAVRVMFRSGSWYEALPDELHERIDCIISNPPYVSEEEWPTLDPEVRHEPRAALIAGPSSNGTPGLAAVEVVLCGAAEWLTSGGIVVIELAPHQAYEAMHLAEGFGFDRVRIERDLADRDRMLVARRV